MLIFSPKRPGRLADASAWAMPAQRVREGGGTGISLLQKQQIQQLWLLQETPSPQRPGFWAFIATQSESYQVLFGSQGLT